MRAWTFHERLDLDDLALRPRRDPQPGPRELLLRMRAATLNYRDLAIARGMYGQVPLPRVPVSDGVGEVIAVGTEVTRFRVGDRVCPTYAPDWIDGAPSAETAARRLGGPIDGVLAELVCVDERAAVIAPRHLDDAEAAALPIAYVTAFQALVVDTHVRPGDEVVVLGTGGVSVAAAQVARMVGAHVTVVSRDTDKSARVAALGADAVDAKDAERIVLERTGGRGADLVFDVVGGDGLSRWISATRIGGSVVLCGFVGGTTASIDLFAAIRRSVTLRAVSGGSRASFEGLVRALETHEVRPPIDRTFAFEEVKAAYRHLAESRPFGKIAIRIGG